MTGVDDTDQVPVVICPALAFLTDIHTVPYISYMRGLQPACNNGHFAAMVTRIRNEMPSDVFLFWFSLVASYC